MLINMRRVDNVGRIVLPKEMRDELNLNERLPGKADGDTVLLTCENGTITMAKVIDNCKICGQHENLVEVDGIKICKDCAEKIYSKIKELGL